jgi:hypothetical protein
MLKKPYLNYITSFNFFAKTTSNSFSCILLWAVFPW